MGGPNGFLPPEPGQRKPVRVHLFDRATGKELWAHDIGAEGRFVAVTAHLFSPDGRRVLLRYETRVPRGNAAVGIPVEKDRVWVADMGGAVERDFPVHENSPLPTPFGNLAGTSGPSVATNRLVLSPDGDTSRCRGSGWWRSGITTPAP